MSEGETCISIRKLLIDSDNFVTSGISRINVDKWILDIDWDSYEVLKISNVNFSQSEWEKLSEYAKEARKKGKVVYFENCCVFKDDNLSTPFFRGKEETSFALEHYMGENNNDGVTIFDKKMNGCQWDMYRVFSELIDEKNGTK